MAWELRRATESDLHSIMAIETATFGTDAWSAATMSAELAHQHTYYLVAVDPEAPGEIQGYAGLSAPQDADHADIQTIAVTGAARRRGLGRILVNALMDEAKRRGADEVFLEVRSDNPGAHSLYSQIGFQRIGVRKAYYQPDGIDAIVMRFSFAEPHPAVTR